MDPKQVLLGSLSNLGGDVEENVDFKNLFMFKQQIKTIHFVYCWQS